jgi:hypothetical protein
MLINQYGGGACSLCGSPGTNKTTCPLNDQAKNKVPGKHPLAKVKTPEAKTPESFYSKSPLQVAPALPPFRRALPPPPVPIKIKAEESPKALPPAPAAFKRALPPSLMGARPAPKPEPKPRPKFTAKAMATINNLFKHFYPIWATYHVNNGKSYEGIFVGHKSSAEVRGFVEYIYTKYHTDPDTMDFWLHGTTKEILDELVYEPSWYFTSDMSSLKGSA